MKTLRPIIFINLLLFSFGSLSAQNAATNYLSVNNVRALIRANGHHFWDMQGSSEYEVPEGSSKTTIYTNTLWIAGQDSTNQLYLSAERYRDNGKDYTTGPLTTDGTMSTTSQTINAYDSVWVVYRSMIDQHKAWAADTSGMPNYTIPGEIKNWPAHGDTTKNQSFYLAPFEDVNSNGVYDPKNGDYPIIRGDQAIFFIFNDAGVPNTESGGTPLGIEIHGMAYAFDCPKSEAFDHTIFMNYKIYNRSPRDYHNTYLSLFTDFDLGYAYDDFIGSDVQRGSIYAYNGKPIDGNGGVSHYGQNPPAQSMTLLGGPRMDADGVDNPDGQCDYSINGMNFGNNVADDERLGLTGFVYFNNVSTGNPPAITDPETALDYYQYMNYMWKDSTHFRYGGNGYDSTAYGPECRFMFPGNSDTCNWGTDGVQPNGPANWTEVSENNTTFDRRGVAISGPFTLESGEMEELDFAFVYGRDTTAADSTGHLASIEAMQANIDSVRKYFMMNQSPCGGLIITSSGKPAKKTAMDLSVYPNPANQHLNVELEKPDTYQYRVYDLFGRIVKHKTIKHESKFQINIEGLPSGVYVLHVISPKAEITKKFIKQ
ncbi:MAG: T9SS type A sorting domain-containing protein [Bacteroidales bacterium]